MNLIRVRRSFIARQQGKNIFTYLNFEATGNAFKSFCKRFMKMQSITPTGGYNHPYQGVGTFGFINGFNKFGGVFLIRIVNTSGSIHHIIISAKVYQLLTQTKQKVLKPAEEEDEPALLLSKMFLLKSVFVSFSFYNKQIAILRIGQIFQNAFAG